MNAAPPARLSATKEWLRRLEVDRAVLYATLHRGWLLVAAPVTFVLLARYLPPDVAGYYFTFASVLALASFVELGLYLVVVNLASHEWAHLRLEDGAIKGDRGARARLVSLGRLVFKWYGCASAIYVVGVGLLGYAFFNRTPAPHIDWKGPWLAMVILSGLVLWALPFNSLLEGCGQVAMINKFRLSQAVMSSLVLWVAVALGARLWASVVAVAVIFGRDVYLLLVRYRRFFAPFRKRPELPGVDWHSEIWPMQWRLALSGAISYFTFSLFTPVMFAYFGPSEAGRMGMTLAAVNALQSFGIAWVQTRVPRYGMLVAQHDYDELDRLFRRVSSVALAATTVGAAVMLAVVVVLYRTNVGLANRILSPGPTVLFLVAALLVLVSFCQSAYLRAHKRDPFVVLSVFTSVSIGVLVWLVGRRSGAAGAGTVYLVAYAGAVLWGWVILRRCRTVWHSPSLP